MNGEKLTDAYKADPPAPPVDALLPGGELPSFGMAFDVESDSARVDGRAVFAGENPFATESYSADLPERVPGRRARLLLVQRPRDRVLEVPRRRGRDESGGREPAGHGRRAARACRSRRTCCRCSRARARSTSAPGAPIPEVTLVTEIEDEENALETLDKIVEFAGGFEPRFRNPTTVEIDGVEARELPIDPPVSLYYAAFDGLLVVTTSQEGIVALRQDSDRLSDSEAFDDALDRAGVPDETQGFGYLDLESIVPLVLAFQGVAEEADRAARRRPSSTRFRASSSTATRTTRRPASRSSSASSSGYR